MKRSLLAICLLLGACSSEAQDDSAESSAALTNWKVLNATWEPQSTGYWCGPTATRIALSARIDAPSQSSLARQLGTTVNGTDYIGQITSGLNANLGAAGRYQTVDMSIAPFTTDQKNRFWDDIVASIDQNYPVVVNIVAPANNHPPGYPNDTIYHYFTVIGYNPDTHEAYIADPANFGGHGKYWLPFDQLASLVHPKGYSAISSITRCNGAAGSTHGSIGVTYRALGGCGSVLGAPITDELRTPDGIGRYVVFEHGSIYWTESTNAHEVLGDIRDRWKQEGWEAGRLGYPISGEYDVPGGRRSDFQHGSITWNASTRATTVTTP